jgi:hypothetical protein
MKEWVLPRRKRHQHEYPNSRIQREKEEADFEPFADAYLTATGLILEEVGSDLGTQDFTCERSDGKLVGVEFTELRRSPDDIFWQSVLDRRDEMDPQDAIDELWRLIEQKSERRANYSTKYNIVLVQNCDADFWLLCRMALHIPMRTTAASGCARFGSVTTAASARVHTARYCCSASILSAFAH